jgi:hypothetical protein
MLQGFCGCFPSLTRANRAAYDRTAVDAKTGGLRQRPLGASLSAFGCSRLHTLPAGLPALSCVFWRLLLGLLELPSPPPAFFLFRQAPCGSLRQQPAERSMTSLPVSGFVHRKPCLRLSGIASARPIGACPWPDLSPLSPLSTAPSRTLAHARASYLIKRKIKERLVIEGLLP